MDYKTKYRTNYKKSLLIDQNNKNMIDVYNYGYFVCTIDIATAKNRYNLSDEQIKQIIGV